MSKQNKFKIGRITVFKRPESGVWFYSFQLNGTKVRRSTKFSDAAKAKRFIEQEIAPQVASDSYNTENEKITLEIACERYLKHCKPRVLPKTFETNSKFATNRLMQDFKSDRNIASFTKQ